MQIVFKELHLNENELSAITYFSYMMSELKLVNFDSNRIAFIEYDAFLNCRSVEHLSVARNYLTNLTQNNFFYMFSLKYLNLSRNRIEAIELDSFQNLNKLEVLDLSFNRLHSIQNKLFFGLSRLRDLYLLSQEAINLYNQSLSNLPSLSNIYLNGSMVTLNAGIFVYSFERFVQRIISKRFVFYKSINMLVDDFWAEENVRKKCFQTFSLLQYKIHLNLKTDEQYELFYKKCEFVLIGAQKASLNVETSNVAIQILTDYRFVVTIILLMILLGPYFCLVFTADVPSFFWCVPKKSERYITQNLIKKTNLARSKIKLRLNI